jgi:hypothetical protein
MKTEQDETLITWTLPQWAADTITETLQMDAGSPAFDKDLQDEISDALDAIRMD